MACEAPKDEAGWGTERPGSKCIHGIPIWNPSFCGASFRAARFSSGATASSLIGCYANAFFSGIGTVYAVTGKYACCFASSYAGWASVCSPCGVSADTYTGSAGSKCSYSAGTSAATAGPPNGSFGSTTLAVLVMYRVVGCTQRYI